MPRFFVHKVPVTSLRPYDAKPLSVMSKRICRFHPLYNRLVSLKRTSALMFSRASLPNCQPLVVTQITTPHLPSYSSQLSNTLLLNQTFDLLTSY
ncbi:hypothetical protein ACTXT7_000062 [Hymenolepis weldensis]